MKHLIQSRSLSIVGSLALSLGGMLGVAVPAFAGGPSSLSISVVSQPTSASVIRPDGPEYYVSYKVTITNNSPNNNHVYDFRGTTKAFKGNTALNAPNAVFSSAAGISCNVETDTTVLCSSAQPLDGKTFSVTFLTPIVTSATSPIPDKLRFTVASTSSALKGSGFADTTLTTQPYDQSITGFYTYVPTGGGIFYTGFKAPGGPNGGKATGGDPWTTTVIVPKIANGTTAWALETNPTAGTIPSESSCRKYYYLQCFDTTLTIPSLSYPSDSLTPYITIYLRIDSGQRSAVADINTAKIFYEKVPLSGNFVEVIPCTSSLPVSGQPCMANRKIYASDDSNIDFQNDWEFEIHAKDNGRYIN